MAQTAVTPLTGRKVLLFTCAGFAVIVAANLTLAYQAVATFPGLEVKNSYVASQAFEADRAAQEALGWDVKAVNEGDLIRLTILQDGMPVRADIRSATLGRATSVAQDQVPDFQFNGQAFVAPVDLAEGNWNLRLVAEASDGTLFKQRIILRSNK